MALTAQCEIHAGETMYEKEYNGNSFWSHKTEDESYPVAKNGVRYCNGKPPKNMANFGSAGYQAFKQAGEAIAHRAPEPEVKREPVQTTDWADKDRRISRMSCQKQAIETMRMIMDFNLHGVEPSQVTKDDLLAEIKELTDHFEQDLNG